MNDEQAADVHADNDEERILAVGGQRLRVRIRWGTGTPLVFCNGIGAAVETWEPLIGRLRPGRTLLRFDAPGVGGSSVSRLPYGFPYLAWVLGRLLDELGLPGRVDVLGYSWGGTIAQQFAFQNPRRCRRLVLVATGTGAVMVPGNPLVLRRMLTPRRYTDPGYAARVAGELYGGAARHRSGTVTEVIGTASRHSGSGAGYVHQLMAGAAWTSLFALPLLRQPTLLIAGEDDPIIPVANARIMHTLLPRAELLRHPGGHVDPIIEDGPFASAVDEFLDRRDGAG